MKPRLIQAYETLQEYDCLLPYETAWGFIWTHLDCFTDQFRPSYNKHLKPFEPIRFHTFYYIDNLTKFLKRSFSDRQIRETGMPPINLAVIYVFVVAIDDTTANDLMWSPDRDTFLLLGKSYYNNIHYLSELMPHPQSASVLAPHMEINIETPFSFDNEHRIQNLVLNKNFLEQYDLPQDMEHDNLVVYTLNLV